MERGFDPAHAALGATDAAKIDETFLDFIDTLLVDELASKQRKRVTMEIAIATSPR